MKVKELVKQLLEMDQEIDVMLLVGSRFVDPVDPMAVALTTMDESQHDLDDGKAVSKPICMITYDL